MSPLDARDSSGASAGNKVVMQDQLFVIAEADQQPPANKSAPANGAAGHHVPRDPLMKYGPAAHVLTTRQLASLAPQKWHIDSIVPKGGCR